MTEAKTRSAGIKEKLAKSRETLPATRQPKAAPPAPARGNALLMLAGGLAAGLVIGALMPRRFGRKALRYGLTGATIASELGRNYGRSAADAAAQAGRTGREKLGEWSETAGEAGRKAVSTAERRAREGRDLGEKMIREGIRIVSNLRH